MKISLIVCTKDRAHRLPRFLEALLHLQPAPFDWEFLIVDHASCDDTGERLAAFAASAPFAVRTMRTRVPTLSGAKNEAIAVARGEILAFTDDDCYPHPDYLLALAAVFDEHGVGVVGGRVLLHDPTDARLSIRDDDTPVCFAPHTFVPAGAVHGANIAATRQVIDAIGGFDPLLGPGTSCCAAEDIDLVARAIWAGWSARYDPAPVVSHHHGRKPGDDTDRVRRGYDYGRGAYYMKFLLNRSSRGVYLRQWYASTRRASRGIVRQRVTRELEGGRRYLVQRFLRGQRPATPMLQPGQPKSAT